MSLDHALYVLMPPTSEDVAIIKRCATPCTEFPVGFDVPELNVCERDAASEHLVDDFGGIVRVVPSCDGRELIAFRQRAIARRRNDHAWHELAGDLVDWMEDVHYMPLDNGAAERLAEAAGVQLDSPDCLHAYAYWAWW